MIKTFTLFVIGFALVVAFGVVIGVGIETRQSFELASLLNPRFVSMIGWAFAGFGTLIMAAAYCEKRTWNNGICRETGEPWVSFDSDSQSGRGYKSGDYTCWISYPVDSRPNAA